jgi:hypothetical protein
VDKIRKIFFEWLKNGLRVRTDKWRVAFEHLAYQLRARGASVPYHLRPIPDRFTLAIFPIF